MSVDFQTIETALATWVKSALGLLDAQIVLAEQDYKPDSSQNWVTLRLGDIVPMGQAEKIRTVSDLVPGEEVQIEHLVMCSSSFSVQVFGPKLVGNLGPRALASTLHSSLELDVHRRAMRTAKFGVTDVGALRWVPAIAGARFEGRAGFDVACTLSQSAAEKWGYIKTIKIHLKESGVEVPRSPLVIVMPDP